MSTFELQVMELGPMLREQRRRVKDKSYRRSPIGHQVGRYIRALRWADKASNTLEAYEWPLALLAIEYDDYESLELFCCAAGVEHLRIFLDNHWGEASPATRKQRTTILRAFFKWSVGEGLIPWSPMQNVHAPRVRNPERSAYPYATLHRLIAAQDTLRDQCALQLAGRLGLRKNEIRVMQIGDIDLTRDLITVHGKGEDVDVMPLEFNSVREDLYLHIVGEARGPTEYLLYPRAHRRRRMDPATVHRWFKRCLTNAGLPAEMKLHELRHSAVDAMWRETGDIVKAQALARHASVGTTQLYVHPRREDLTAGMHVVEAAWLKDAGK